MRILDRLPCPGLVLACLLACTSAGVGFAQDRPKPRGEPNPIRFLEPLVGTWEVRTDDREAPFPRMVWSWELDGNIIHKTLGLPDGDGFDTLIEGIVAWNPWERRVVEMRYNKRSELFYSGWYEQVAPDKIVHTYVVYSDWQPSNVNRFRETITLIDPKTARHYTERFLDGEWKEFMRASTTHKLDPPPPDPS